jgi:hypothetical protein
MKNPQEEAIRRKLESLSDRERADLSAKINNVMYGEQEQADSSDKLSVRAMLADASIPDSYKYGTRLNEAFLAGVEYAERVLTANTKTVWLAKDAMFQPTVDVYSSKPTEHSYLPAFDGDLIGRISEAVLPEVNYDNSPVKVELRIVEDDDNPELLSNSNN